MIYQIGRSVLSDLIFNKVIIGYFFFLSLMGWGIFMIEGQPEKAFLALLQITLVVIPMITLVFATIYYYNAYEFILLLLSQPIRRTDLFIGIFGGILTGFIATFLLGICVPLLYYYPVSESLYLLIAGVLLSCIFTAIAFFISTRYHDKTKGLSIALVSWAFFTFLFDGLLILFMYQFAEYPIEEPVLALSFLNPIDISRIFIIMKTDASAMIGLSGAVFQKFFTDTTGQIISVLSLIVWFLTPFILSLRKFSHRNL